VSQELASIQHLAPANSYHPISLKLTDNSFQPQEIFITAVMVEKHLLRGRKLELLGQALAV